PAASLAERVSVRTAQLEGLRAAEAADAPDEAGRERIEQLEEQLERLDEERESELERELAKLDADLASAAERVAAAAEDVRLRAEELAAADQAAEVARAERREAE